MEIVETFPEFIVSNNVTRELYTYKRLAIARCSSRVYVDYCEISWKLVKRLSRGSIAARQTD